MKLRIFCKQLALSAGILPALLGAACSGSGSGTGKTAAVQDPVLSVRAARDEAFRSDGDSPIPEKDRGMFKRLQYYPVNEGLKFSVRLNRHPRPERVRLATNTGEVRSGLRYGYFEFAVEGRACRLQVYRMDDSAGSGAPSLFIPFRDATSGSETYASGRYMDLAENTSGIYDLDFNRAYNPYCAYSSEYSCPIPPAENTLTVPIRAGEKKYIP
ncbi:MAG: DUF1684 domain-containing protein [Acidobacteria bacterium]|nr:DUF1684 domain-containing protein [Acidobacteriota bacterium]